MGATNDEPDLSALAEWRQGDYSFDLKGYVVADLPEETGEPVSTYVVDAEGIVVLSQTCDVVRADSPLESVIVAPLLKVNADHWKATERGARARYAIVRSLAAERIVADLTCAFSITKQFLVCLNRERGHVNARDAIRFSMALERLFGRFAFPDGLNDTLKRMRDRALSKHPKAEAEIGAVYRSIWEIRLRAAPGWDAEEAELAFIFVLNDELEVDVERIHKELSDEVARMKLPGDFRWSDPPFVLGGADELSARDILESQPIDIHIVSGPS